jgi:hypothetical protein
VEKDEIEDNLETESQDDFSNETRWHLAWPSSSGRIQAGQQVGMRRLDIWPRSSFRK